MDSGSDAITPTPFLQPIHLLPAAYLDAGWVLVPIPFGSKGPAGTGAKDWNARERCVDSTVAIEAHSPCNWGLAHAYSGTMALDIDNWPLAEAWLSGQGVDLKALYLAPDAVAIQSGKPGHAKLVYRLPDGIDAVPSKKIRAPDGKSDILDFRCGTRNGRSVQDVLPPSIHPETGQPYSWRGDWRKIPYMPVQLWAVWQQLLSAEGTNRDDTPRSGRVGEVSIAEIRSALDALDPDVDYSRWIQIGMALHDTDPDFFHLWDDWSAQGSKYPGPAVLGRHWKSFSSRPGDRVTIGTLFHMAAAAGWQAHPLPSVADMFGAVGAASPAAGPDAAPAAMPAVPLSRFVYVKALDKFLDTTDGLLHGRDQMNAMHPVPARAPSWTKSFFQNARWGYDFVQELTYLPNGPRVTEDGSQVNTWKPSRLVAREGSVKPWLWLLERLVPDIDERQHVLQWMAYTAQHPETKINHSLLLVGPTQGQGKDTLFEPLHEVLGRRNCGMVFADALEEKANSWLKDKKLIFVQEIMDFMDKGKISNRLKPLLASPPEMIQIRELYVGFYELPNLCNFVFFSNEEGSMRIVQGDRRYFAIRIEAPPLGDVSRMIYRWYREQGGYAAVAHYLLTLDLTGFDPGAAPPMTRYKEELIELSRQQIDMLLLELFEAHPEQWQVFTMAKLRGTLAEKYTDRQLSLALRRIGCSPREIRHAGTRYRLWTSSGTAQLENLDIITIFLNLPKN